MAVLLRAQEIEKSFGVSTLFEGLNLSIDEGERLGIIGPNGVGKSTLLKILAGLEAPDSGTVVPRKALHMAYVPQMASYDPALSLMQVVEAAAADAGLPIESRHGAAHIILGKVGFEDPEQLVSTLSGGWQKRLTLACGLVSEPDLVLFDEPTNHLDTRGVLWLEELLADAPFAWVLISHDRYFLNRTTKRIAELNPIFPDGIWIGPGNYNEFKYKRGEFIQAQEQYIESIQNKVRRETEWLRAGVKARTTKAKYRIDSAHGLIEELEGLRRRTSTSEAKVAFSASERQTRKLIETKSLVKKFDGKAIVDQLDLVLSPRKRVGLLGANGSGKTTLLRLLTLELKPDSGQVLHAPNLQLVYFDQQRAQLDPSQTLREALSPTGTEALVYQGREIHLLAWAKRFKFSLDQLSLPVSRLSGGEQARLLIARLMLRPADVLILDEPSNDLDIPTLELLEESLLEFTGSLVLVTHDRYMLDRICTHFLGLDGRGQIHPFASYDQWEKALRESGRKATTKQVVASAQVKVTTPSAPAKVKKDKPVKLSFNEKREWEGMEAAILAAESEVENCRKVAEDPAIASNGPKLITAHEALAAAEIKVAGLYDRWAELSEKLEASSV